MVKLQDGSLVAAADLINGAGEDPEGKPLKFTLVKDASMPAYEASAPMNDGSGRTRKYSFGFEDTNVVVHLVLIDERAEKAAAAKAAKAAEQEDDEKKKKATSTSTSTTTKNEEAPSQAKKPWVVEKAGYSVGQNQSPKSKK